MSLDTIVAQIYCSEYPIPTLSLDEDMNVKEPRCRTDQVPYTSIGALSGVQWTVLPVNRCFRQDVIPWFEMQLPDCELARPNYIRTVRSSRRQTYLLNVD